MPIIRGFDHIATLTTDLERHAAWYGEVFGAEVTFRMEAEGDHPRMFILDMGGGAALNVFEVSPERATSLFAAARERSLLAWPIGTVSGRGELRVLVPGSGLPARWTIEELRAAAAAPLRALWNEEAT